MSFAMLGSDLKHWREARGWTQSDLMKELDVSSRQTVTSWESSIQLPRLVELAIVALDQVEACNRRTGHRRQFTPETIANRWFAPVKKHVADTGVEKTK
jgi:transcriptional regulator with XRE-family HTH domain